MDLQVLNSKEPEETHQEDLTVDIIPISPNKCYKFLPRKSKVILIITQTLLLIFLCTSLYGILGKDALPGSEIFALLFLGVFAHIAGKIVCFVKLPPLIGMLIVGFLFRNLSFIPYYKNISIRWATTLRSSAFVIILLRAGLGLDAEKLRKLSRIVFQLAFTPCIVETMATAVASHFLLGLPWAWAIMLGFIISAVSPAVIVPGLLSLQSRNFGIKKGIPTLVIAAASVDDIIAITGFTVMLSISFAEGSLWITVLKGVLEPVGGLLLGFLFGTILWFLPSVRSSQSTLVYYHTTLLCLGGFAAMFLSKRLEVSGVGPMACLVLAFTAALRWKKDVEHFNGIQKITDVLWNLLQPFLFSLIGSEVSIDNLHSNLGNTILALLIGLVFRILAATLATFGGNLNIKERVFIAFAWLPKATVQAAVGPQALDYVLTNNEGPEMEDYAKKVLTAAVVSIIMTAPIGAALIAILGPKLLSGEKQDNRRTEAL